MWPIFYPSFPLIPDRSSCNLASDAVNNARLTHDIAQLDGKSATQQHPCTPLSSKLGSARTNGDTRPAMDSRLFNTWSLSCVTRGMEHGRSVEASWQQKNPWDVAAKVNRRKGAKAKVSFITAVVAVICGKKTRRLRVRFCLSCVL
jgi:hypothetical protein